MVLSGPPHAFSGGEQSDFKGFPRRYSITDGSKPKLTHLADLLLFVHNIFFVYVKGASWQLRHERHKNEDVGDTSLMGENHLPPPLLLTDNAVSAAKQRLNFDGIYFSAAQFFFNSLVETTPHAILSAAQSSIRAA